MPPAASACRRRCRRSGAEATLRADSGAARLQRPLRRRGDAQRRTCALAQSYGQQGHDARALFALLLRFAVSEDGALHAEKYYRTVSEEFAAVRPAFRWRQLVALTRVTASEYGQPAPGYADACRLLKV